MLNHYSTLRQTYIVDGFTAALEFIQNIEQTYQLSSTLLTNFYCYITIQAQFKAKQILSILNNCLIEIDCCKSLRAITLYHIASVYFKQGQYKKCREICQQLLQQFIGMYYSIQMRLDKNQEQIILSQQLQQIIYYVFLMLAYISRKQNKLTQSNVLLQASKRIIKDRKDLFSLTTKTTVTKIQNSEYNNIQYSPTVSKKQNIRKEKGNVFGKGSYLQTY